MATDHTRIPQLIATLAQRDVRLWVEDGALKFSAPPGAFDDELKNAVRAQRAELVAFLQRNGDDSVEPALPRAPALERPPLSAAEQSLWFRFSYEGPSPVYNVVTTMSVESAIDLAHHRHAVQCLVDQHDSLRTRFAEADGVAYRVVQPAMRVFTPLIDLSAIACPELRAQERDALIALEEQRLFALDRGPLLNSFLIRLGATRHVVVINVHHVATDATSSGLLGRAYMQMVEALEERRAFELEPVPARYADFAWWQQQQLANGGLAGELAYWRRTLDGLAPLLDLPTDYPRPAVKRYDGRSLRRMLPSASADALAALSRRHGATLFMGLLAVFKLMLARYCRTRDVAVGTAVAGRRFPELANVVGMFTNTIVVRTEVDERACFGDLLRAVRDSALAAQANQDVPFSAVVKELVGERDLSYTPIYQVSLALNSAADRDVAALAGLGEQVSDNDGVISTGVKDDLSLQFRRFPQGLEFKLTYDLHLFAPETAARMVDHFEHLLNQVLAAPERPLAELALTDQRERERLGVASRGIANAPAAAWSLDALFRIQCARRPHAIAVQQGERQVSYGALAQLVEYHASRLHAAGARPLDRVGLCVDGAIDMVAGMLAILEVGAAYVPLDRAYPRLVLDRIVADTGMRLLLCNVEAAPWSPTAGAQVLAMQAGGVAAPASAAWRFGVPQFAGEHPAYVIYTSGSTGTPKGVEVSHSNVIRLVQGTDYVTLGADDVLVQMSNQAFDAATFEVWGALTHGGRLVGIEHATLLDPIGFPQYLREHAVSTMFITTALFNHLAESDPAALASLRTVMFGGEAANSNAVRRVFDHCQSLRLLHVYGPTENTTFSTWHAIRSHADAARCPIGSAIAGSTAYVVDAAGQLLPHGIVGELLVGGAGVAHGYLGRPDLTAERFIPDPYSRTPGQRLYRTGDWVKRGSDGAIDFIGRFDNQVKIRGFRIETGEIVAQLTEHPDVSEAVVVVRADARGDKRLYAYVVSSRHADGKFVAELAEFMRERLSEYKQPSAYLSLPALPLTPNGKVDHAQLPDIQAETRSQTRVAPRDELERSIAAVWCELLGLAAVGSGDNFFELGGHSLLAITLSVRLRERLGIELTTRDVFECPTLEALAARVREARHASAPVLPPIVAVSKRQRSVLSYMQQRLWFVEQMQGPGATYHMPIALRLSAAHAVDAIQSALVRIVERHESLRTAIVEVNGIPLQRVSAQLPLPLEIRDLRQAAAAALADVDRLVGEAISLPFDLASAPLFRATLIRLPDDAKILVLTLHHIVCDGWSLGVLMSELGSLLRDPAALLPVLPVQYGDYAFWQKSWLEGEPLEKQMAYWRAQLTGAPPLLQLRCARPRPPERRDPGRTQAAHFGLELAAQLKDLAVREGCSLFMTLLAAFNVLLARYAGHGDIVVGTPIANRPRSELEPLIGFFANTLPLRTQVREAESFIALLQQVRESTLQAYAYQDTPLDLIVDALGLERSLAFSPLVQVAFAQENFAASGVALPDGVEPMALRADNRTAKFDLNLSFEARDDGLQLWCEYNLDLYDAPTIVRLLQHYQLVLESIVSAPERLLRELQLADSDAERRAFDALNRWADAPRDARSLQRQFADVVQRNPQSIALIGDSESLTYAELDRAAERLAARLRAAGVVAESLVGVCMQRSPQLVVAVLAIVKAGGAYVPMDSDVRERIETIVAEAALRVVVVDATAASQFSGLAVACLHADRDEPGELAPTDAIATPELGPDALAYVMYTSGSTGTPKGVAVTQGAISRLVRHSQCVPSDDKLRFILSSSTAFDAATLEVWAPLLNGGGLVVIATSPTDLDAFTRKLRQHRVTTLWLTASLFDAWAQHLNGELPDLELLLTGGDVVSPSSCARVFGQLPQVRLVNGYGPTENTTFSAWYDIPRDHPHDQPVPIGGSLPNSSCRVLDAEMHSVPLGLPGILYVGGHGLARGYFGRPDLTAERFVPDPFASAPGERLYCTGDRVQLREDGVLLYLGRSDRQVKIRGFRVELGEVEALLRSRAEVLDAAVIAHVDATGEKRLVAFVVPRAADDDLGGLRESLRQSMPAWLLPSLIVPLDAMPVNANGKADRKLLEARVRFPDAEHAYVPPASETEARLAAIWSELLSRAQIGRHDSFFALGGHSLLAAQVCARINQQFGIDLRVRTFYASRDLAELAATVDEALGLERLLDDIDLDTLSEEEAERLLARMQPET